MKKRPSPGYKRSPGKKIFHQLETPFVFLRRTVDLVRIHNTKRNELQKLILERTPVSLEDKQAEMDQISHLIDLNMKKVYLVLQILAVIIIGFFVYTVWGKADKTEIFVDVVTNELIIGKVDDDSHGGSIRLKAKNKIAVSVAGINKTSALNGTFTKSDSALSALEIGLAFPSNALISLSNPDTSQTIIGINPLQEMLFGFDVYGESFKKTAQDKSVEDIFDVTGVEPTEISRDQSVNIALRGSVDFELKPLKVQEIYFNTQKGQNNELSSSLISGVVHLLDTKDDSITLYQENYLSIDPTRKMTVYISKKADGFHVKFTANVSRFEVGSLYETDVKDRMPLIIKTKYDQYPYLWVIFPVLIPVLAGLFKWRIND